MTEYSPIIFCIILLVLGICFCAASLSYLNLKNLKAMKPIPMCQLLTCVFTIVAELLVIILYSSECGTTLPDCPKIAGLFFCFFDWACTIPLGWGYAIRLYSLLEDETQKRLCLLLFIMPVMYGNV